MKSFFIILLCFLYTLSYCPVKSNAQTTFCPPNINFETGTFTNWILDTGVCCPILMMSALTTTFPAPNRHIITNGSALDTYGKFPIVAPGSGSYSLKLGNTNVNSQSERAKYYIRVPPGSGRYILVYRYAVVFQDPKHAISDQPRFEVRAYDSATNAPITCAQFSYVSQSGLPGFSNSIIDTFVHYKPWTTATLDLTGRGGTTVIVTFASGDCGLGAHFGYGYVDMNCGLFQTYALHCNNSGYLNLKAPNGYQKYKWIDSATKALIDTVQNAVIPLPSTPKTYAVILTPYPGYGCPDTLFTTYKTGNVTSSVWPDTTICLGEGPIQLHGTGSSADTPVIYTWAPTTGLSCIYCQNPTVKPKATTKFLFTTTSSIGCEKTDTAIVVVDTVVLANLEISGDSLCMPVEIDVKNKFNNPLSATYAWTLDGATILGSYTRDSMHLMWPTPGAKRITLNVVEGICNSADTVIFHQGPAIFATGLRDTNFCIGKSVQLITNPTSSIPVISRWSPVTGLSCTGCPNPFASPSGTTRYIYRGTNIHGCLYKDSATITIDTVVIAKLYKSKDSICPAERVTIFNYYFKKPGAPITYSWSVDNGTILSSKIDSIQVYWGTSGNKKIRFTMSDGNCSYSDSVYVFVRIPIHVIAPPVIHKCLLDSAKIPVSATPAGSYMYWWFPTSFLTCGTCPNPTTFTQLNMSYRVTVSNEGYCADTATTKIIIDTIGANIMLPKDTICQNENIILKNTAYNSVNINNKWSLDSAIIISNDGKGTVEVKWKKSRLKKIILTSDGSACDGSDSVSLYVRPTLIPKFSMSDTGCFGQPVVITPDTTDGRYYWSADEQKTIIKDFNPVSFTWASTGSKNVILVLKDKFLCDSLSDSAKVTIYQNPNITLNVIANNRICDGDLITFTVKADGIYSYRWEPNNAFENISGSNAAMTVPGNVNVSVKAINEWGCYANANMVIVTDNCCAVFMPDAFTPNNDGKNDTYRPIGIDNQKIEKYMVLNRWGQVLYEGNNPLEGWDGSLKGEKQDAGIYFYYIKYKCGSKPPIEAKGNFMLMR